MANEDRRMEVRVDGFTRFWLAAIGVLLVLLVIGLWGQVGWPERGVRAAESFGDASAQRKAILEAQEKTNGKLDQLIQLFKSGEAKVQGISPSVEGEGKARVEGHGEKDKTK